MSFDWKKLVGSVAPVLGTALGGPLAGVAVKSIAEALGLKSTESETNISKALQNANPETLVALKNADLAFESKMAELNVDLEQIASNDRANARNREILTKDKTPKVMAYLVIVGFFITLGCIAFIDIVPAAQAPVNILIGALTGLLLQIGNYIYGSSVGSKEKTNLLGKT